MSRCDISPQPAYIFDADKNHSLYFDGVVKIQHSLSVKIEDDPKNVKKTMVNHSKLEPTEVSFDVVMSNVYTTEGDLPGSDGNRLTNAFETLNELRVARRKVDVVTQLMTYKNMVLKSVSVAQDEGSTDSWMGSITFHEILEKDQQTSSQTSSPGDDGTQGGYTPSILFTMFGTLWG